MTRFTVSDTLQPRIHAPAGLTSGTSTCYSRQYHNTTTPPTPYRPKTQYRKPTRRAITGHISRCNAINDRRRGQFTTVCRNGALQPSAGTAHLSDVSDAPPRPHPLASRVSAVGRRATDALDIGPGVRHRRRDCYGSEDRGEGEDLGGVVELHGAYVVWSSDSLGLVGREMCDALRRFLYAGSGGRVRRRRRSPYSTTLRNEGGRVFLSYNRAHLHLDHVVPAYGERLVTGIGLTMDSHHTQDRLLRDGRSGRSPSSPSAGARMVYERAMSISSQGGSTVERYPDTSVGRSHP
ncbi:hypothetical protein C8Q77DRAFT_250736 [Trametes polyzona]|nr:hypothetical protein C8Q77DRAFT_250736 [Trametes polyzona]